METLSSKIALIVVFIGSLFWLGGIDIRAIISFNLLLPGTLDFKPNIHPYVERTVFALIAQCSVVIISAYAAVWIAGLVFLRTTSLRLKENGWLMMSAILFYLFTPVEIYTIVLDARMWYLDHIGS